MSKTNQKYSSATHYILSSLIPYTEANLKLTFIPQAFFADLKKIDRYKENTLRNAYHRAIEQKLVIMDELTGQPIVTQKGLSKLAPYRSKKLKDAKLMITFDIPEEARGKRQQLRTLLKQLEFKQAQKSVWTSELDSREYLKSEIMRLGLSSSIVVYECREI